MSEKHTVLPWRVDVRTGCVAIYPASESHHCFSGVEESFIHSKHWPRSNVPEDMGWKTDEEAIANAKFICLAANHFEEAVKLIETIEKWGGHHYSCSMEKSLINDCDCYHKDCNYFLTRINEAQDG